MRCGFDYVGWWAFLAAMKCPMPEGSEMSWMRWALGYRPLSCDGCQYRRRTRSSEVSIAQMVEAARFAQGINTRLMVLHPGDSSAKEAQSFIGKAVQTVCVVKEARAWGESVGRQDRQPQAYREIMSISSIVKGAIYLIWYNLDTALCVIPIKSWVL